MAPTAEARGALVVSELSWLRSDAPQGVRRFWDVAYPAMQSIPENSALVQAAGYQLLGQFTLDEAAWWKNYYTPIENRLAVLRESYRECPEALEVLEQEQAEIDMYRESGMYYGYVFYIMLRQQ